MHEPTWIGPTECDKQRNVRKPDKLTFVIKGMKVEIVGVKHGANKQ